MAPKTTKKTATKTPKGQKVTREVELDLDDKILVKLGKERGDKLRLKADIEEKAAADKAKWDEKKKPITDRLSFIDDCLKNGKEKRTVECTMVKNYDENKIEWWFEDRVVDHRPMTVADRQEDLPIKTKKGRDAKKAAANDVETTTEDENIANVHRLETNKRTKHSAADGPIGKGHQANGVDHT